MKKTTLLALLLAITLNAQQGVSIQLDVFQDLATIDLAAFLPDENISNQPRIMRVSIFPENTEVVVEGVVEWKRDENSNFEQVASFKTKPFLSRTFYNDELDKSDLSFEYSDYNSDIISDIVSIGRLKGIVRVVLKVQDTNTGAQAEDERIFTFLNPTPPEITSPIEDEEVDVGSIIITWDQSPGASGYIIRANYMDAGATPEDALNSGDPLVDDLEVEKGVTQINLTESATREILPDTNIVVSVTAKIEGAGEVIRLASQPRVFRTSTAPGSETAGVRPASPAVLRLANFLQNKVSAEFVNKLLNGEIKPEEIKIFDNEGNQIDLSVLNALLDYLEQNGESIISIDFKNR
ncbi:hypothetical protein ACSSWA_04185 [Melioribacter sp. Ez-97]|uniref:hypothetical protein n=1 Tax=Melioribacter sp. Ez-97 TaxID=3423434 RepID=UPI003ED9E417